MSEQYDVKVLRKLQLCELEIFKDFARICDENGLMYFGFSGTGIGAVRHGGFIPWDDDIDVAMPRTDYEKLIKIIDSEFKEKYTFVNAERFSDFPVMNAHLILNNSKFITSEEMKAHYPRGIFLDIFPLDNVPTDKKMREKQNRKAWLLSKLLIVKHIPFPHLPLKGIKAKAVHCITAVAWFFLNVFHITHKYLYNLCLKECTKFNDEETGIISFLCDTGVNTCVYEINKLLPLRKMKFEDVEMNFPNNLEETLVSLYGDYMQIPPESERRNHRPDILEFPENLTEQTEE